MPHQPRSLGLCCLLVILYCLGRPSVLHSCLFSIIHVVSCLASHPLLPLRTPNLCLAFCPSRFSSLLWHQELTSPYSEVVCGIGMFWFSCLSCSLVFLLSFLDFWEWRALICDINLLSYISLPLLVPERESDSEIRTWNFICIPFFLSDKDYF